MSDKMKRLPPSQIYLQWFAENDESPPIGVEVTWCEDRMETTDTEYTREDICESLREQIAALTAVRNDVIEECAKEAEHWQEISNRENQPHACGQYIAGAIRALKGDAAMPTGSNK